MKRRNYLTDSDHGSLEISVKDSGQGIRDDQKDKLFNLFELIDTKDDIQAQGLGFGLHISKRIVE